MDGWMRESVPGVTSRGGEVEGVRGHPPPPAVYGRSNTSLGGGGAWHKGLGIRLFAFGGAHWPLATAHSDPLWARTCFGCVNGAPG